MNPSTAARRLILLLTALLCIRGSAQAQVYSYEPEYDGPWQIGFKAALIKPRGTFGIDFGTAPAYELYAQRRSDADDGEGPWTGRIGLFYANLKPRLDTIPTYGVREYPTTLVLPGYDVYQKLDFKGLYIDYAYSIIRYKKLRVDAGVGLMMGLYHLQYVEDIATLVHSSSNIEEYFTAVRPRVAVGYKVSRYFELCAEYTNTWLTNLDWSSFFPHDSYSIGLNFTFQPYDDED